MKRIFCLLSISILFAVSPFAQPNKLLPYVQVLRQEGKKPVAFAPDKINMYDLLLFDDALHSAYDPFEFYQDLIKNKTFQQKVKYIFLEVFAINQQPAIDNYLAAKDNDTALLYPLFQNDYSGYGWKYQTYVDLLNTLKKLLFAAPLYFHRIRPPWARKMNDVINNLTKTVLK